MIQDSLGPLHPKSLLRKLVPFRSIVDMLFEHQIEQRLTTTLREYTEWNVACIVVVPSVIRVQRISLEFLSATD